MQMWEELMAQAIAVCQEGIAAEQSPFGSVIATRHGEIVCAVHNTVRATGDVTAHAEINAIRTACSRLGTIDLSGHVLASTCEPCPMCAAAIHWARLDAVAYGATIADAAEAGFNELSLACQKLYEQGHSPVRVHTNVLRVECRQLFTQWQHGPRPEAY
ncbi:MAG: nucleoside deaminase [Planctomycetes bacterium]|nr:nucleoside deaminase [Planctomycetota bacterium]